MPAKNRVEKVFQRAQLCALAWSWPMRTLAPHFGVSDVALRKTLIRLGIPVPEDNVIWAKYAARKYIAYPQISSETLTENLTIKVSEPFDYATVFGAANYRLALDGIVDWRAPQSITRLQLYNWLRAGTITSVGNTLGLSSHDINRICRLYDIPTPATQGAIGIHGRVPHLVGTPSVVVLSVDPDIDLSKLTDNAWVEVLPLQETACGAAASALILDWWHLRKDHRPATVAGMQHSFRLYGLEQAEQDQLRRWIVDVRLKPGQDIRKRARRFGYLEQCEEIVTSTLSFLAFYRSAQSEPAQRLKSSGPRGDTLTIAERRNYISILLDAMVKMAPAKDWTYTRDLAVYSLIYYGGFTIEEVRRMAVDDLDLLRGKIGYIGRLGEKVQGVIPNEAVHALTLYGRLSCIGDTGPLFFNTLGSPMQRDYMNTMFNQRLNETGMLKVLQLQSLTLVDII